MKTVCGVLVMGLFAAAAHAQVTKETVPGITNFSRVQTTIACAGATTPSAVAEVKKATRLPVIVNGDIIDTATAREALTRSGADAVMIARGIYGRPWAAAGIAAGLAGEEGAEPDAQAQLGIALEHFRRTLSFYGEALGLRIFRKHLGWYLEQAPFPVSAAEKRAAKSHLCQIDKAKGVESGLIEFWSKFAIHIDRDIPI